MNMKARDFNGWPWGIAAVLVAFAAGVAVLVVIALRNPHELVARDYYEQELRYQEQIDRRTRASALPAGLQVRADAADGCIEITFPEGQVSQGLTGNVRLYRPSDAGLDRTLPVATDASGVQRVGTDGLAPGLWRLRVEWAAGGKQYAAMEEVRVNTPKP
jgi:hypothetical protein